ncbi:MAG: carotenoid biosynthesis protein [Deltaproteobacteria bacterium]|nr:carotenoid biosynthesis protein [Deltaproteobacteria bacterium]
MTIAAVEVLCVALLALGVVLRARTGSLQAWRRDAAWIFVGAWLGEQTCIQFYDFYRYDPGWHGWLGDVPVLIPVIWIVVVLSARDVATVLRPANKHWLPLAFLVIWYDASLIEPIATHAGLWRWNQAGPFAVPWIGMLGWALYGAAALAWLQWLPNRWRWSAALLAPATTHALLLAVWWGGLRWIGRGTPDASWVAGGSWLVAAAAALALWRTGRLQSVPLALLLPRMPPAAFFFALLATTAGDASLAVYAGAFALPWLAATRWPAAHFHNDSVTPRP